MTIGLLFWILMVCWLIFGFVTNRTPEGFNYPVLGGSLIIWILLALLGWRLFGAAIR
jgi:hypothetical protein